MSKSVLNNEKVRIEIEKVLEAFKKPDSLEFVAKGFFKRGTEIASDNWSILNKLIMMVNGTSDARTFQQWKSINRFPKKGSHAFFIFAPILVPDDKAENKDDKKKMKLVGYRTIPEFKYESTEGDPVNYNPDKELPVFCGSKLAEKWGITIKQGFENPLYYAFYSSTKKEIVIASDSQQTFFHEISHAADEKITGTIKGGQNPSQEIVAEFSAAVLMNIFGLKAGTANTYQYIERYAKQLGKETIEAVIPLIGKISKVINLIINESNELVK